LVFAFEVVSNWFWQFTDAFIKKGKEKRAKAQISRIRFKHRFTGHFLQNNIHISVLKITKYGNFSL